MNICFHVSPLLGSSIEGVAHDMQALADRLDIEVQASFNGFVLIARPGGRWETIFERYVSWSPTINNPPRVITSR